MSDDDCDERDLLPTEPPTPEQIEEARRLAVERGWLVIEDDGRERWDWGGAA